MFRHALLAALLAAGLAHAGNLNVSFKAFDGRFVVAEGGGGRELAANRTAIGPWETFALYDWNGGTLEAGDVIALRANDGHFVSAENGGGGEVNALRDWVLGWESFKIERADLQKGSVENSNVVDVRIIAMNGRYWSANNGGLRADGTSRVAATSFRMQILSRPGKVKLSAPFARPIDFGGPVGFDLDAPQRLLVTACTGFFGQNFPNCYDQHQGSDFMLRTWFPGQILGHDEVLTAAAGLVIATGDGNVDTCFAAPNPGGDYQIQCPGNPDLTPNFVKVLQDDGDIAWYYHLKRNSVSVSVGQRVTCGQRVGEVGSSGVSSAPHLHFQLQRDGVSIDPYTFASWAQLGGPSGKIPQRTCNVPPPPVCTAVQTLFNCSSEPAATICNGVNVLTGGCVARNPFNGACLTTCAQVCGTINQTVTVACP
ncbi:MAG: peptidoglycan DD-metalloendopeptidase family protein [Archangium sp.]